MSNINKVHMLYPTPFDESFGKVEPYWLTIHHVQPTYDDKGYVKTYGYVKKYVHRDKDTNKIRAILPHIPNTNVFETRFEMLDLSNPKKTKDITLTKNHKTMLDIGKTVYLVHKNKIIGARVIKAKVNAYIRQQKGNVIPEYKSGNKIYNREFYNVHMKIESAIEDLKN